jgi:UDP-N-acetyl-D-galactosamine dehydrogenase
LQVDRDIILRAYSGGLRFTTVYREDYGSNVFIVTVPTPVDSDNRPDLGPLREASEMVGRFIRRGGVVIYESTVYPGVTEDVCLPIIERVSGLRRDVDFFAGYSPERVNPGDGEHTIENTVKIISGTTPEAVEFIDRLYGRVISAGVYCAPSIRVAEAAKVIENAQRDVNIAFMNEAARIFNAVGIDTGDVLSAASTKWNFLRFKPGLVGGHCIGVDTCYLTELAKSHDINPELMLAARSVNGSMGDYIASRVLRLMGLRDIPVVGSRILVLGFAFKEDCTDCRNTRVADIVRVLSLRGSRVDVFDPVVNREKVEAEYGVELLENLPLKVDGTYNVVILCVEHSAFRHINPGRYLLSGGIVYDAKGSLKRNLVDERL